MMDNIKLKQKSNDKYLGQMIETNLAKSALSTAKERSSKIKGATIEIKNKHGRLYNAIF